MHERDGCLGRAAAPGLPRRCRERARSNSEHGVCTMRVVIAAARWAANHAQYRHVLTGRVPWWQVHGARKGGDDEGSGAGIHMQTTLRLFERGSQAVTRVRNTGQWAQNGRPMRPRDGWHVGPLHTRSLRGRGRGKGLRGMKGRVWRGECLTAGHGPPLDECSVRPGATARVARPPTGLSTRVGGRQVVCSRGWGCGIGAQR